MSKAMAENTELTKSEEVGQGGPFDGMAMDRLSHAFETSAKRWELIVYPTLFAFIILAAYGFYLVFSLAKDVHYLAISVDSNMTVLASNMQSMSDNVSQMSSSVTMRQRLMLLCVVRFRAASGQRIAPAVRPSKYGSSVTGCSTGRTPRLNAEVRTSRMSPGGTNGCPVWYVSESHVGACQRSSGR
mgnify:CR=1 FL=1